MSALPISNDTTGSPASSTGVQAIQRALLLLELLSDAPRTGAQLVEQSGLTRSTALRILSLLVAERYAVRTAKGTYALGPRILELAARQHRQSDLAELARPHIDALVARFEETATLSIREGLSCVCISGREGSHALRLTITPGSRTPLHAGAAAKILLAFAPEPVHDQVLAASLEKFSSETVTHPRKLKAQLDQIRTDALAVTFAEIDPGIFAVAAPIQQASGDVAASLAVAGLAERIGPPMREEIAEAVREAASSISSELGFSA